MWERGEGRKREGLVEGGEGGLRGRGDEGKMKWEERMGRKREDE